MFYSSFYFLGKDIVCSLIPAKAILISVVLIFTGLKSRSQATLSISQLAQHNSDCPEAFRGYAVKELGCTYQETRYLELGICTEDKLLGADNMIIVKSYAPSTIMEAKGKGVAVRYVKENHLYSPRAYEIVKQAIQERAGTPLDLNSLDYIELQCVPARLAATLQKEFEAEGAERQAGCFVSALRQSYCYKNQYAVSFEAHSIEATTCTIRIERIL
jgi:hypothetical protein